MAFTVEDGTGVAGANAYISVTYFRDFHVDRGVTAAATDSGTFTTALIQAAIVKATDYVDKRFGRRFIGYKKDKDNALQWPRLDAWDNANDYRDSDDIPADLEKAVAEYAMIAIYLNSLLPVPAPSFNQINLETGETTINKGGLLQRDKQKVGPIETEQWFNQEQWRLVLSGRAPGQVSTMSSLVNLPEYPVADEWLNLIVKAGGMSMRLERG